MYHRFSPDQLDRLFALVGRVGSDRRCGPDEAITWIEGAAMAPVPGRRALHDFADGMRRARMRRRDTFGGLDLRDPSWDMLLDLYVAHCRGEPIFVSKLCHGAGVPHTTALRHLDRLERGGHVCRVADSEDYRRTIIAITPQAIGPLEDILTRMQGSA